MNWETLGNIFEGWKNLVFKDPEVEKIALKRLHICSECPVRTDGFCDSQKQSIATNPFEYQGIKRHAKGVYKGCGCVIEAKARCLECKCPLGKW